MRETVTFKKINKQVAATGCRQLDALEGRRARVSRALQVMIARMTLEFRKAALPEEAASYGNSTWRYLE